MKKGTDFLEELCTDEAVCFIADRHHVMPRQLLHYFFTGTPMSGIAVPTGMDIPLEPNEVEILKDLSKKRSKE